MIVKDGKLYLFYHFCPDGVLSSGKFCSRCRFPEMREENA